MFELIRTITLLILLTSLYSGNAAATNEEWEASCNAEVWDCFAVSGTGIHYFSTAIAHNSMPTPTGKIDRTTDTVELYGDVRGRVLYHPKSVFDFAAGTLTNTGDQVFSGTVGGYPPVLIHDNSYRFEVNLFTGETSGRIVLDNTLSGQETRCYLEAFATGQTPEGDANVGYTGWCKVKINRWIEQNQRSPVTP